MNMSMKDRLQKMIDDTSDRRLRAARQFEALDFDRCQLCGAQGPDMRSLILNCGYAVHEVVPEAIDLFNVPDMKDRGYFLRICKSCRGSLLGHLKAWRDERVARQGLPMDNDGDDADELRGPERCIPVRENGTITWLTWAEWDARRRGAAS